MSPRVSIGVPVYQGARHLREALESLLEQTFPDFEVVVCDNASSDATEAIARELAARDRRIRYHRNERNLGAAANFNLALALARGRFFKWMAHDDRLEPGYLETCLEVFESAPPEVVLVFPRRRFIDQHGAPRGICGFRPVERRLHGGRELRALSYRELVRLPNDLAPAIVFGLMRREVLSGTRGIGGFRAADLVLNAEMALRGELWQLPEILFVQRVHAPDSWRANLSLREQAAWYSERVDWSYRVPTLRLGVEYLRSIRRAPLPARTKAARVLDLRGFVASRLGRATARRLWAAWAALTLLALRRAEAGSTGGLRLWHALALWRRRGLGLAGALHRARRADEAELLAAGAGRIARRSDPPARRLLAAWAASPHPELRDAASAAATVQEDVGSPGSPASSRRQKAATSRTSAAGE